MDNSCELRVAPAKSRFRPSEDLEFQLHIPAEALGTAHADVSGQLHLLEYGKRVAGSASPVTVSSGQVEVRMENPVSGSSGPWPRAYAVRAEIPIEGRSLVAATAVDVAPEGHGTPRPGFLSRFGREDLKSFAVERAVGYHLTHLQFYDWMYRHEQLLPPNVEYRDALGRALSLETVVSRVRDCHEHGVVAQAYGAIYGAGRTFADAHQGWSLFRRDGERYTLMDWLFIMNVSPDCPWTDHLIEQYRTAAKEVGFDGFHMDTYGYPKHAYDSAGRLVRLEHVFSGLVEQVRKSLDAASSRSAFLTFNAVNNWPAAQLAHADTNALYIEVWSPNSSYRDLWRLIREARLVSSKPVILAAYLSPFLPKRMVGAAAESGAVGALLYATAVITSAGGSHLVLGESDGILCDPYYVNHGTIPEWARPIVRRYYDFLTAYGPLFASGSSIDLTLDHAYGPDAEFEFAGGRCSPIPIPGSLWATIRETGTHLVVTIVNLTELTTGEWNESHQPPEHQSSPLTLTIVSPERLKQCLTDTPDPPECVSWTMDPGPAAAPRQLEMQEVFLTRGPAYRIAVPPVRIWRVLVFEKKFPAEGLG